VETIRALQNLYADWRQRLELTGTRSRVAYQALELLMERPLITTKDVEQRTGCSPMGARKALSELEQLGIIVPQGARRPRLLYIAPEVLRIVQGC
ncbi:MAG: hypothetical protein ABDI19_07675, partial [Armatimonadota bacterium]